MKLPPSSDFTPQGLVASYLLARSRERGEALTNLKLQKLLYYAQAWHLAIYDKPLFDEDFQAWVHGPVLPTQYFRFRHSEWRPIEDAAKKPDFDERSASFLEMILDEFGSETAVSLELMTHRERPWREARGALPKDTKSTAIISKATMKEFYRALGNGKAS